MQMNAAATNVARWTLKTDAPSANVHFSKRAANAPGAKRAAYDGPATHQLHFANLPVIAVKPVARETTELLQRWLQDRSDSMTSAVSASGQCDAAIVLSNADRFFLGHAASALKNLQCMGIAGCAVIHLSTSCLIDPLLPAYVISLLQRRGVRMVGVSVTFVPGRQPCPSGASMHGAASQSPACVRQHTDARPGKRPSWVDALFARAVTP